MKTRRIKEVRELAMQISVEECSRQRKQLVWRQLNYRVTQDIDECEKTSILKEGKCLKTDCKPTGVREILTSPRNTAWG